MSKPRLRRRTRYVSPDGSLEQLVDRCSSCGEVLAIRERLRPFMGQTIYLARGGCRCHGGFEVAGPESSQAEEGRAA